jgi:hypothetical protein
LGTADPGLANWRTALIVVAPQAEPLDRTPTSRFQ